MINPEIKQINKVWIRSIRPIAKGCFIKIKIVLQINLNKYKNKLKISKTRNSLIKILILEINDKGFSFFLKL